jgi:hypothetical protein
MFSQGVLDRECLDSEWHELCLGPCHHEMMKYFLLFCLIFLSYSAGADTLTLYFIESPFGINWRTPWHMTTSTLKNQMAPSPKGISAHTISHTYAEISCDSSGARLLRGMTSDGNTEERDLLFKQKYGLGIIFHTFRGRLEKEEDLSRDLSYYFGKSRMSQLTIKISPEACQRMVDYAHEYETRGFGKMYAGLQADPLKGEGAGCSAFVISFMEVAGLLKPFTNQWVERINVPLSLVGGPMTRNKVSIGKILKSYGVQWSDKVPHFPLKAWNPEKMHQWVKKHYRAISAGIDEIGLSPEISRFKNTRILTLDMRDSSVPQGPFWKFPLLREI